MENTTFAPNKPIVSIYTEATPNPESMKFVTNRLLLPQNSADFPNPESAENIAPIATQLFANFDSVNGVFIMNNFITITKKTQFDWFEISGDLREFIRQYLTQEKEIIDLEVFENQSLNNTNAPTYINTNQINESDSEVVKKIKELIQTRIQPAVENDGGSIVFRSFENGTLMLGMQGSCSGCPSSTVTLKMGIERMMKLMVPEVQNVEAEAI